MALLDLGIQHVAGVVMADDDVRWMLIDEIHTGRGISVGCVKPVEAWAIWTGRQWDWADEPRQSIPLRYSFAKNPYFNSIANAVAIVCGGHDEP